MNRRALVALSAAIFVSFTVGVTVNAVGQGQTTIPSWIKNTAKFWVEGEISDQEFIAALQYLADNGILKIPSTPESSPSKPKIKAMEDLLPSYSDLSENFRTANGEPAIGDTSIDGASASQKYLTYYGMGTLEIVRWADNELNQAYERSVSSIKSEGFQEELKFEHENADECYGMVTYRESNVNGKIVCLAGDLIIKTGFGGYYSSSVSVGEKLMNIVLNKIR